MNVALVNPPFFDVYKGFEEAARLGASYPPSGLLYLAGKLLADGHNVRIYDMDIERLTVEDLMVRLRDFNPGIIGMGATTPIMARAEDISERIKQEMDTPIVLGGIHVTIEREAAMRAAPHIDYAVLGEGEITLSDLVASMESSNDVTKVPGLLVRLGDEIIQTPARDLIRDLDTLNFPPRELLAGQYNWLAPNKGNIPIAVLFTKRGCPFMCSFCSQHSMYGRKIRSRSVENVLEELDHIINRMGIDHILILDDTLVVDRKWMLHLCREIRERKLVFTWEGMARASHVDKELIQAMADVGLVRLSFGIESGDDEVLKRIHKGVTTTQIRQAYKWAKEAGIETRGSAIIGHPGETQKTAWRTVRFLWSLHHLDQVYLNIMVPYPGTEVFELASRSEAGYRLLSLDYNDYIRYEKSVLEVNDLDSDALRKIQKIALLGFYLHPRRFFYNLFRSGFRNGFRAALAFAGSLLKPAPKE